MFLGIPAEKSGNKNPEGVGVGVCVTAKPVGSVAITFEAVVALLSGRTTGIDCDVVLIGTTLF